MRLICFEWEKWCVALRLPGRLNSRSREKYRFMDDDVSKWARALATVLMQKRIGGGGECECWETTWWRKAAPNLIPLGRKRCVFFSFFSVSRVRSNIVDGFLIRQARFSFVLCRAACFFKSGPSVSLEIHLYFPQFALGACQNAAVSCTVFHFPLIHGLADELRVSCIMSRRFSHIVSFSILSSIFFSVSYSALPSFRRCSFSSEILLRNRIPTVTMPPRFT